MITEAAEPFDELKVIPSDTAESVLPDKPGDHDAHRGELYGTGKGKLNRIVFALAVLNA